MEAQVNNELTLQEKSDAISNFCNHEAIEGCFCDADSTIACPLAIYKDLYCYGIGKLTDEKIIRNYDTLLPFLVDNEDDSEEEEVEQEIEYDPVKLPEHYAHGSMETIDEMKLIFGIDEAMVFCKLNAWKYRARAPYKGNAELDMQKSDQYLQMYKKLKAEKTV